MRGDRDKRIRALEVRAAHGSSAPPRCTTLAPSRAPEIETIPAQAEAGAADQMGRVRAGKGLILMRSDIGEVDLGLVSYLRYLQSTGTG